MTVRWVTETGSLYELDAPEGVERKLIPDGLYPTYTEGLVEFFNLQGYVLLSGPGLRVRRLEGSHDPTPRQGVDGSWRDAEVVMLPDWTVERLTPMGCAVIVWEGTKATVTSRIEGIMEIS